MIAIGMSAARMCDFEVSQGVRVNFGPRQRDLSIGLLVFAEQADGVFFRTFDQCLEAPPIDERNVTDGANNLSVMHVLKNGVAFALGRGFWNIVTRASALCGQNHCGAEGTNAVQLLNLNIALKPERKR